MSDAKCLVEVPIEENLYKPDMELSDRYQKFSAEILRLALLCIAGVGFLISEVPLSKEVLESLRHLKEVRCWLIASVFFLALAVGGALAHQYLATDCISDEIQYLRKNMRADSDAKESKAWMRLKLKSCAWILVATSACLFLGVVCVAVSYAGILF